MRDETPVVSIAPSFEYVFPQYVRVILLVLVLIKVEMQFLLDERLWFPIRKVILQHLR